MDTVLARSVGVRPENKIVMKCPSWPDTPLHQYFGSRKSNQRISDFAMSSLGYVRLYEYCCPCERKNLPVTDPDLETSFVHIEERMRSDGPFILYRRPPQRRVGIGLSERAREKRLLKYYKYFQGFQRKFQVSKQFQQTHHKPENKARVKKIINCYKRKITPQESSSAKPSQSEHVSSPKPSNSKQTNQGPSTASSSQSVDTSTSQLKNEKVVTPNARKKKNTKVNNTKAQPSVQKELAYMAAVLACMDTSMNVFLKKPDRGTLMTPTLATIEEVTGDCDVAEPEPRRGVAANYTPRVSLNPDLPKKNQHQETIASHTPPTGPRIEPNQLRGILKHPKQTPIQSSISKVFAKDKEDPVDTTSAPLVKCEETSSGDPEHPSQKPLKPKIKKSRRTKKTSANVGTPGDDISSAGDLKVTENVTLMKEVKPKARRFRPVLKRSAEPTTSQSLSASASGKFDEVESTAVVTEAPENPLVLQQENVAITEGQNNSSDVSHIKKTGSRHGKKSSTRLKVKQPPGNIIKFRGWDLGSPLGDHSLGEVPEDKDLCMQKLERTEKLLWEKYTETPDIDGIPCTLVTKPPSEKPDAYLQEQSIAQIFEHLTRSLVIEQSAYSYDKLQLLARDLTVQHANLQGINQDLQGMKERTKPKACARFTDTSINQTVAKLVTKPRKRIGSILKRFSSPVKTDVAECEAEMESGSNEHVCDNN